MTKALPTVKARYPARNEARRLLNAASRPRSHSAPALLADYGPATESTTDGQKKNARWAEAQRALFAFGCCEVLDLLELPFHCLFGVGVRLGASG